MYNFVTEHWKVISGVLLYIALALVGTMPPKGTKWSFDTLYDWFYDFTHMLVNQRGQKKTPLNEQPAE